MCAAPSTRTLSIALGLLMPFAATGCGDDDPLAAIDRFEKNRQKAQAKMDALEGEYANCAVPTSPAASDAFAEEWKKRWDGIEKEVNRLKSELNSVIKAGDKRFKKMDEMAKSIQTKDMREAALAKNNALAKNWTAVLREAGENVKKMDQQVALARDIYKVIKLDAMRAQTEHKIAEIRALNAQMRSTVLELSKVTAEGRALLR
ncbi:MAG: hypothetical protein FJ304_11295 [Planctomycetes bacterium]|nr:hypothetical protein [Planctomycetota bacterium]